MSAGAASAARGAEETQSVGTGLCGRTGAPGGFQMLPEARVSGGGRGPETPGTAETATTAATLTDCRAGGESGPHQLCNSLSSHFGSLRLRGRF